MDGVLAVSIGVRVRVEVTVWLEAINISGHG